MKRPLLLSAAALLSGTLIGLAETKAVLNAAVLFVCAALVFHAYRKSRDHPRMILLFCAFLFLFFFGIGFLRAKAAVREYDREEARAFFQKFSASNPGQFDYGRYLKSMGVSSEEERQLLSSRSPDPENGFQTALYRLSQKAAVILEGSVNPHDSGIYQAMLLGNKSSMDDEIRDLYQASGIAHLLAVSGLHVSLIGMTVFSMLRKTFRVSVFPSVFFSSLLTVIYAFFTGGSGSSLRASVMFSVSMLSVFLGRSYDLISSLCFAGILLLLKNPYLILQSGFQFSFSAIAGVCMGSFLNQQIFPRKKTGTENAELQQFLQKTSEALISGISVTLCTMPALLSGYSVFPVYSILLNLIVIPLMTVVMISGICVLLFGGFSSLLTIAVGNRAVLASAGILRFPVRVAAAPGHFILRFYEVLCRFSQRLPGAQQILGKPSEIQILLYCLVIVFVLHLFAGERKGSFSRKFFVLAGIAVLLSAPLLLKYREKDSFYVEALDMGQGDCFHIHNGQTDLLIDGGSSGYEKCGENIIEAYLLSRGISEIDAVFVSHADADHINGLYYLLSDQSAVKVKMLVLPSAGENDEKYSSLKEAAGLQRKLCYLHQGNCYSDRDGLSLLCLYCGEKEEVTDDTNRQSEVLLLKKEDFSMLFTGDITGEEEEKVIAEWEAGGLLKHTDILKCAHHGSATATTERFLKAALPKMAVLSYKKGNRYGHPSQEVVDRLRGQGIDILSTAELGAIKITKRKGEITVHAWKK